MPLESADVRARVLCDALTEDLEPIETQCRLAEWEAECTGADDAFQRVEKLSAQSMVRLADRADFASAKELLRDEELAPDARREVHVWRNRMARHQVDKETIARLAAEQTGLVQQFNSFRAHIGDRVLSDNDIDNILRSFKLSKEVEAAWRASKEISRYRGPESSNPPVAERLLDLVRLRNHAARQIGYPNSYQASLELGELDPNWLFETLELLERETRPLFQRWKAGLDAKLAARFGIAERDLRPWHYGDRFFQTPPIVAEQEDLDHWFADKDIVALTVRTFDELGFDIRPIVERSDLFPGDPNTSKKCQHAFCTTIVAPGDVRVLCNLTPTKRWMATNLHEFGHAIYGASLDASLPYVLRDDPHTLCNEAIALFMERHMLDAGWLERVAEIPARDAERIAAAGKRELAIKHLVFTHWVFVMCYFERDLYENPDRGDLPKHWWDIVGRFQGLARPEPDRTEHDWSSKIHFVGHPAYYQNYLLGELFGAQLQRAIEAECGGFVGNQAAGRFLVERMFQAGSRYHWQELLERMTGERLNPRYFLDTLKAAE